MEPQEIVAALKDAELDTLLIDAKLPKDAGTPLPGIVAGRSVCCTHSWASTLSEMGTRPGD